MATKYKKTASKTAAKTAQSKSANRSAPAAAKKTAQKLSPTAKAAKPNKPAKGQKPGKTAESKKKALPPKATARALPPKAAAKAPPPKATAKALPPRAAAKALPPKAVAPAAKAPPAPAAAKPAPGRPLAGKPGAAPAGPVRGTPGQIVPTPSRTPARSPVGAEELKLKIGALYSATSQIKALKRSMSKGFWEIGRILAEIQEKKLFEVKGYGSFEAFIEREIDLGKLLSLRLVRITQIFVREAALAAGYERATAGLAAFDGETDILSTSPSVSAQSTSSGSTAGRQMLPPHKL